MFSISPCLLFIRKCFAALLIMVCTMPAFAQSKVHDVVTMDSKILKMERKYAVYLPPSYETSERSYPILYLLHGASDDQTGWVQFGEVQHITDKATKNGTATEMIIIMPDADTGQMGYFNSPKGDWDYEDFFFEELMPHVEQKYRVKSQKRFRAIAGLSMGGGGSFMYALHRPDLFSSACPLSAYVGRLTLEAALEKFQPWEPYSGVTEEQVRAWWPRHNAVELVKAMPEEDIKKVRWYIDCGDDDFLYEGNSQVHVAMTKKKIPHEYRVRDGGHSWTYWRSSLPKVLEFVSQSFHQY